jgi:hypothetical protein
LFASLGDALVFDFEAGAVDPAEHLCIRMDLGEAGD